MTSDVNSSRTPRLITKWVVGTAIVGSLGLLWAFTAFPHWFEPRMATPAAEFQRKYGQFLDAIAQCDSVGPDLKTAIASGGQANAYAAANAGEAECYSAADRVREIEFQAPIADADRSRLNASLATCAGAYAAKGSALAAIAKAYSEDLAASAIEAARQQTFASAVSVDRCSEDFERAVKAAGFWTGDQTLSSRPVVASGSPAPVLPTPAAAAASEQIDESGPLPASAFPSDAGVTDSSAPPDH